MGSTTEAPLQESCRARDLQIPGQEMAEARLPSPQPWPPMSPYARVTDCFQNCPAGARPASSSPVSCDTGHRVCHGLGLQLPSLQDCER